MNAVSDENETAPCHHRSSADSLPEEASSSMTPHSHEAANRPDSLPQPHNSNHMSAAPFKDKLLTNSSYLAAEIPHKFGHFMSHLWMSGSEISSSFFMQRPKDVENADDHTVWLLGCPYVIPRDDMQIQREILEAQKDTIFPSETVHHALHPSESDDSVENDKPPASDKQCPVAMAVLWPPDLYEDFISRLWMTYRHNYPPIRPSAHRTDIGWGCMLRSGQSMLANTLLIHFFGRGWRRKPPQDSSWKMYARVLHWFLDELSPRAPFSIHRIALLGKQLGKNIGEWFGPSTLSQVLQALVMDYPPAELGVYVATDGVIYRNDVYNIAHGMEPRGGYVYLSSRHRPENDDDEEVKKIFEQYSFKDKPKSSNTFKSLLILVAVRLGIDRLHPTYYAALKACFELPYFVGIAGGRPNSSLYFVGLHGDELVYLDPHYSRPALETRQLNEYTEEDFSTYHCTIPRKLHISNVDPSMLLGFYCRTEEEFGAFSAKIAEIMETCTPIFTIEDAAPEYDEDIRSEHDFGIVSDEEMKGEHHCDEGEEEENEYL